MAVAANSYLKLKMGVSLNPLNAGSISGDQNALVITINKLNCDILSLLFADSTIMAG